MGTTRRLLSAAVAAAVLVTACGGGDAEETEIDPAGAPDAPTAPDRPHDPATADDDVADLAVVARSDDDVAVHTAPDGTVDRVLPATTDFGSPRALLVTRQQDGWLEVLLPGRPNGSTGWVAVDTVELRTVAQAIHVDLASRTLTLTEGGREVLTTPVAVGTAENPTPTGEFYVTDKLATDDPGGAYGPFAFGISGYSETLSEFAGGDGQVGIHGTDSPADIGRDVSHGCVRVPNDVAETLNQVLLLGTPVTIT